MPGKDPYEGESVPLELQTNEFHAAWEEWIEYRTSRRLLVWRSVTIRKNLRLLAEIGPSEAIRLIEKAIARNWNALDPDFLNGGPEQEQDPDGKPRKRRRIPDVDVWRSENARVNEEYMRSSRASRREALGELKGQAAWFRPTASLSENLASLRSWKALRGKEPLPGQDKDPRSIGNAIQRIVAQVRAPSTFVWDREEISNPDR